VLIRLGYDLHFDVPAPTAMIAMLHVHPSRACDLLESDHLRLDPDLPSRQYYDAFGNSCSRFLAPPGKLRLWNATSIQDSGNPDPIKPGLRQVPVQDLPDETLQYLLSSRYCEVDRLSNIAAEFFGHIEGGWARVQAVCDWVHQKVIFGYNFARPTKTALDVYTERNGVCRDFQHLAITLCRGLNIPARYATGYLGDIGIPPAPSPMDFSAWFEVYLENSWWAFDARHNQPRIGRILMAVGRDAADVAITTSFGQTTLTSFTVVTEEVAVSGASQRFN
jgi:transglutaminase-like putative cysteine protease